MTNFTSVDLIYKDYFPTVDGGDNPKYIGVLDRKKVDKTEEYEVVHFCNQFLKNHKLTKKESFQKVEELLRDKEITNVDDREELIKWIEKNW